MKSTVWGDGFSDDGWADFIAVRSWETCSTDELVRYFPRLAEDGTSIPSQALGRLDESILRRAGEEIRGRSMQRGPEGAGGTKAQAAWWTLDRLTLPGRRTPWRAARFGAASDVERRAVVFLQDVCDAVRSGSLGSPDEALVTAFAFHASIHPAYIWPTAVLSHERETAACWLGHVARGRAALLPSDLADYILDGVEPGCGTARFRDQHLARATAGCLDVRAIMLAAVRRATGRRVVVRQRKSMMAGAGGTGRALWSPNDPSMGRHGRDAAMSGP